MVCSAGSARISSPSLVRIVVALCFVGPLAWNVSSHAQAPSTPSTELKKTPQDSNTPPAEQILSSYEGQAVTSVGIAGRPDLNTSDFESKFAQKEGQPFSREKVNATVAAIKSSGQFQNVRVQVEPLSKGLRILYVLEPAVWYGVFQFPGAERFAYSRLVQVSNYTSQTPYDAATVEQDRQRLLRFFRQEGHFKSNVTTSLQTDTKHGVVNVVFHCDLGKRAKFGDVNIAGVSAAEQKDLHDQVTGTLARFRGAAVRHGKTYKRTTLNKATKRLESHLQKQGYLAAQVKLSGAEFHADTNRADIHFNAAPGTKTKVQIQGAHLWSWTKKTLLPVYQGVGVDPETVQEGEQALSSYYQKKGYFDIKVSSETTGNDQLRTVIYRIAKGKKHSVTDVNITGEQQLKEDALTPHLAVQKKHFLSHGQFSDQLVRASIKNLKGVYQSQGFSNVQVTSNVINHEGNIEVTFHVVEGPRDVVSSLAIQGANTFPESQFAPKGLKLAEGQPYSQANVQSDRAGIMANYFRAGYHRHVTSFHQCAHHVHRGLVPRHEHADGARRLHRLAEARESGAVVVGAGGAHEVRPLAVDFVEPDRHRADDGAATGEGDVRRLFHRRQGVEVRLHGAIARALVHRPAVLAEGVRGAGAVQHALPLRQELLEPHLREAVGAGLRALRGRCAHLARAGREAGDEPHREQREHHDRQRQGEAVAAHRLDAARGSGGRTLEESSEHHCTLVFLKKTAVVVLAYCGAV